MKKISRFIIVAIIIGLLSGVVFQGYPFIINKNGQGIGNDNNSNPTDPTNETPLEIIDTNIKDSSGVNDVSTIVENVMPSIVAITSTVEETKRDFFGREYSQEFEGSGSGIIIGQNDSELLIVTNNHVIEGARTIKIVFSNNTTATATLSGSNSVVDLAVLTIDLKDLDKETIDDIRIATIGSSNDVKLGEIAIAIGNALGYGQSVTVGHISAISRDVEVEGRKMKLMQTDAAINPGNSGGALLNARGEVIGINTIKVIGREVESIGYAIPITEVIEIINQLINRTAIAKDQQGYLGIAGREVTEVYSNAFNMPVGVFVSEVVENSAADKAGIKEGDIITGVNNIPVESQMDLTEALRYIEAGTEGTVTVQTLKNGEYVDQTLEIVFGERN